MQNILKQIRYLFEALAVKLAISFFSFVGPQKASGIGSFLARAIGKKHKIQNLAHKNLGLALPNLSENDKEKILDDMWDNLGRVIGEYIHIAKATPQEMVKQYVVYDNETSANIDFLRQNTKGGIIFSGHMGNWEIGPKFLMNEGLSVGTVYRPLNNPYVEKITAQARGVRLIAKSSQGNRQIIEAIKNGEYVLIMADQKISDGEPVKFFHDDAFTTTAIARIALKYNIPLIPARSIRLENQFKFLVDVERPLAFQKSDDINKDALQLTRAINQKLESWITEYPAQWFWVHDRWKK